MLLFGDGRTVRRVITVGVGDRLTLDANFLALDRNGLGDRPVCLCSNLRLSRLSWTVVAYCTLEAQELIAELGQNQDKSDRWLVRGIE